MSNKPRKAAPRRRKAASAGGLPTPDEIRQTSLEQAAQTYIRIARLPISPERDRLLEMAKESEAFWRRASDEFLLQWFAAVLMEEWNKQ